MNKRVILVTGSSRGIGANLIENFSKNNYNVVINYSKSKEEANKLYKKIIDFSGNDSVLCLKADVGNRKEVNDMFDKIYFKFKKLDVMVNNAGINRDRSFLEMSGSEWSDVIDTILTGSFNCSQEFAKRFK